MHSGAGMGIGGPREAEARGAVGGGRARAWRNAGCFGAPSDRSDCFALLRNASSRGPRWVAAFSFPQPRGSLPRVLREAVAVAIADPQIELSRGHVLFRGAAEPAHGLSRIPRDAFTRQVQGPHDPLRPRVSGLGERATQGQRGVESPRSHRVAAALGGVAGTGRERSVRGEDRSCADESGADDSHARADESSVRCPRAGGSPPGAETIERALGG
jgi:hypothetical protein